MKLIKSLVIVLVAVSVFGMASSVMAAEAGAAKAEKKAEKVVKEMVTVVGIVNVTRDSKNEVTGIELKADDGVVYQVAMNAKGKALEKDNGKKVEATGIVLEKDGKKILRVKSCKVEAEPSAK
jgi:hypothetical protein